MADVTLKPTRRTFSGVFVGLDFDLLRTNIQNLIDHGSQYFSLAPDTLSWQVVTKDGSYPGEAGISELSSVFEKCSSETVQIRIEIFKMKTTKNIGLRLYPDEYIIVAVDFQMKELYFTANLIGETNSKSAFELAISGITLIGTRLPPEHHYLERLLHQFHQDHPTFERNVFLIMRFQHKPPFPEIVESIREQCTKHGLDVVRADDKEYTDDLWDNVMTYIYGCKSAIAVFDQINYREFNPNVTLEVGFMLAQCKRVLLLKDVAIEVMPTDIIGKVYRPFNTYEPHKTIPSQIEKWVIDYQIGN